MRRTHMAGALLACLLIGSQVLAQEILKFAVLPEKQKVYPGFVGVGPASKYHAGGQFGWTVVRRNSTNSSVSPAARTF